MSDDAPIFEERLGGALTLIIAALVAAQVIARYLIGHSLTWSEELVRYLFVLATFIGVTGNVARGSHLSVHVIPEKWRSAIGGALTLLRGAATMAFSLVVACAGVAAVAAQIRSEQTTPGLGWPRWVLVAIVPLTMAGAFFRTAQAIMRPASRGGRRPVQPR